MENYEVLVKELIETNSQDKSAHMYLKIIYEYMKSSLWLDFSDAALALVAYGIQPGFAPSLRVILRFIIILDHLSRPEQLQFISKLLKKVTSSTG